ncbi:MAG: ECF transporter S component [Candidatus Thorarchaeota archaeon]|nr:MAG: ECF transporter S component [Candidatus Thorarchaeota archaeon]
MCKTWVITVIISGHDSINPTLYLVLLAIMTALTTVATVIIAIPFPTSSGYLNFGDVLVMTSGLLLGPVGGFVAGGVGSMMGDIALGYVHFAPITFIVKGTEGLLVGVGTLRSRGSGKLRLGDVIGIILGAIVMMLGYYLAEIPMVGQPAALAELISLNSIQVTVGGVVTALIGPRIREYLAEVVMTSSDTLELDGTGL